MIVIVVLFERENGTDTQFQSFNCDFYPAYQVGQTFNVNVENAYPDVWMASGKKQEYAIVGLKHEYRKYYGQQAVYENLIISLILQKINSDNENNL